MFRFNSIAFFLAGFFPVLVVAIGPSSAFAAPCCGSSSAAPSILAGDDQAQLSVTASQGTVIGDAPASGLPIFHGDESPLDVTRQYRIDAAVLLTDRWQAGASVPVITRSLANERVTRLGDSQLGVAYEAMPEWSYSKWKPKGFVYTQLTLPTARSIYDTQTVSAVDATGLGFCTISVGALFVKRWASADAYFVPEIHRSLARAFGDGSEKTHVSGGLGASVAIGWGTTVFTNAFRLGLRFQPIWNLGRRMSSGIASSNSALQRVWNVGAELSYLMSDDWTAFGSYTDQTLLGPASNSTLSRTVALGIQRRWGR